MNMINLDSNGFGLRMDFVKIEGDYLVHKQIENKNGMTFMRMKKRKVYRI